MKCQCEWEKCECEHYPHIAPPFEGLYPTGSRYVGNWHKDSDYDFYCLWNPEIWGWLQNEIGYNINPEKYGGRCESEWDAFRIHEINIIVFYNPIVYQRYAIVNQWARLAYWPDKWESKAERVELFNKAVWENIGKQSRPGRQYGESY